MEINADRVIKNYLDALDSRPWNDPELCAELGDLYNASKRPHIGMAFMALAAGRFPRATEIVRQYEAAGNVGCPALLPQAPVEVRAETSGVLCAGSNSRFFPFLLNMIGSAQLNSWRSIRKIVVCDLGLTAEQAAFLNTLDRVELTHTSWPLSFQAWKFPLILDTLYRETGPILYLDAGCYVDRDLEDLFRIIDRDGHLFFFNAPYEDPIHLTRNWTSRRVYEYFGLQKEQDSSVTAISTLMGVSGSARPFVTGLVKHNDMFLLRPHSDCIDNRYDQSLFSVFVQQVEKRPLLRFENYLRNAAGYGSPDSYITIHRSKVRPGDAYAHLRAKAPSRPAQNWYAAAAVVPVLG